MGGLRTSFSQENLRALHQYQYVSHDTSVINPYFNVFWNKAVTWLPLWMAPNLVTLLGLLHVIAAWALVSWNAPYATDPLPPWICLSVAVAIFVYQTLDAIDGKQARRTGSASPLGELFDHGCDAICGLVLGIIVNNLLAVDNPWVFVGGTWGIMVPFFLAQWEQRNTDVLSMGLIGPTEAQLASIGLCIATAYWGKGIWKSVLHLPVISLSIESGTFVVMLTAMSGLYVSLSEIKNTLIYTMKYRDSAINALKGIVAPIWTLAFATLWSMTSPSDVMQVHSQMFSVLTGMILVQCVGRMIVSRVMQLPSETIPLVLLPLLVPIVVHNVIGTTIEAFQVSFLSEETFLYAYTAFSIMSHVFFVSDVISAITEYLGIYCLSLGKRCKTKET